MKNKNRGRRKYLSYVSIEQGIAIISGILKNEITIKLSINIVKAFIEMRKILNNNGQVFEKLTTLEYK
ncbi:MAG: hypothetical protein Q4G04_04920 [bacterium]|nr:hypothetical protein [bacterium]